MHLTTCGSNGDRPVLLLHGGGVAGWMWNALADALQAEHLVLVPDLLGHGESAGEPYRSHEHTVAELARMLREAAAGPAAVVGFSLGAQLTVKLAAEHPELVDRVVVVSAQAKPMPFTDLTLRSLAVASPLARRRWFARLQARELFVPQELMENYIATSARISRETMVASVGDNLRFGIPAEWSDFPGRALILAGQGERKVMRESATALHAALPGSELEIVPKCGHGIPFQKPEWFHARVAAWLNG